MKYKLTMKLSSQQIQIPVSVRLRAIIKKYPQQKDQRSIYIPEQKKRNIAAENVVKDKSLDSESKEETSQMNQVIFKPIYHPESVSKTNKENNDKLKTNTGKLMLSLIPSEESIVKAYDNARFRFRQNQNDKMLRDNYLDVCARVEIKILSLYRTLRKQLNDLENSQWQSGKNLALIPSSKERNNEYNQTLNQLKKIKLLRSELKF